MRITRLTSLALLAAPLLAAAPLSAQGSAETQSAVAHMRATVQALNLMATQGAMQERAVTGAVPLEGKRPACRMLTIDPSVGHRASPMPVAPPSAVPPSRMPVAEPLCDAAHLTPEQQRLCATPPDATGACTVRADVDTVGPVQRFRLKTPR